jgi:hypothetical protein
MFMVMIMSPEMPLMACFLWSPREGEKKNRHDPQARFTDLFKEIF